MSEAIQIYQSYERVIPRDLFNEAKLLKGLGQLSLLIHDGKAVDGLVFVDKCGGPNGKYVYGWTITQDPSDGNIHTPSMELRYRGHRVSISSCLNSRSNYTLEFKTGDQIGNVLTEEGELDAEFVDALEQFDKPRQLHCDACDESFEAVRPPVGTSIKCPGCGAMGYVIDFITGDVDMVWGS